MAATAEIAAQISGAGTATVLDVGARWGAESSWWRMRPLARLVGFEPEHVECARLNAERAADELYLPFALAAAEGPRDLHCAEEPACSSLFPPDDGVIARYPILEMMRVRKVLQVPTTTVAALVGRGECPAPDFLKIDAQGAELEILQGCGELLRDCCGVEAELMFTPMYTGQPLFSDVERYLRPFGLVPWRIKEVSYHAEGSRELVRSEDHTTCQGMSQELRPADGRLFWANVVFLRQHWDWSPAEQLPRVLRLAALLDALGDRSATTACLERILAAGVLKGEHDRVLRAHCKSLPNAPSSSQAAMAIPRGAGRPRLRTRIRQLLGLRKSA